MYKNYKGKLVNKQLLLSLSSIALSSVSLSAGAQTKQPNILWIITDDQRPDALECWNKATRGTSESALGYVSSPNVDKLASEGTFFINSYCNSPVSAPSRASMHTGKYPHHNGIPDFRLTQNQNDFASPLVTDVMHIAGYQTTLVGKLGTRIANDKDNVSFGNIKIYNEQISMENDLERKTLTDRCHMAIWQKDKSPGVKEFIYYPNGEVLSYYTKRTNAKLTDEDIAARKAADERQLIIRNLKGEILSGVSSQPTEMTIDGRIAQEAIAFWNNPNRDYKLQVGRTVKGPNTNKPQFMNLGFHFPHTAVVPSKEFRDKFAEIEYDLPAFTQEEFDKMPEQVRKWQKNFSIENLSEDQKQQIVRDYYAFCAMGDKLIGDVVAEFKKYCETANQEYIIVYACGDHGWHLNEQGVSYKASGYTKSNQTAVIVVSSDKKKFPAGKIVEDFVEYVDFYPTFVEAAGFNPKDKKFDYLDGRSLYKTALNKVPSREYILGETSVVVGPRGYIIGKDFSFSMKTRKSSRMPSNKYAPGQDIKWALTAPVEELDMALFDLRVDPNETNNLAYSEEYAGLANWFRNKLGNILLGDGRIEVNWETYNDFSRSDFALGADDKKLDIPKKLIPKI